MKKDAGEPLPTVGEMLRRATDARRRGYRAAAWRHLKAALACDPQGRTPDPALFRADLLLDDGREVEAAVDLEALAQAHPGNIRPLYRLAVLRRRQGDKAAAWRYLTAALACDPQGRNGSLRNLQIDLLIDDARHDDAEDLLLAALKAEPGAVWARRRLAVIAERRGDLSAAAGHLRAVMAVNDDAPDIMGELARLQSMAGDFAGAVELLETLRQQHGSSTRVLLRLLHAYRELGDRMQERACLDALIVTDPLAPELLRLVFVTYGAQAAPEVQLEVLEQLRGRVRPELLDELYMQVLSVAGDHAAALRHLLSAPKARRSEVEALSLAVALFGTHRYELGQRYLRACMRRWPQNRQFLSHYVNTGLKLGRYEEVEARLRVAEPFQPERCIVPLWFNLCAYQGRLDAAVAYYKRMQQLGLVRIMHQHRLITLIFCLPHLDDVPALFDRVGRPNPANVIGRNQSTLPGQQMTEVDLERRAVADSGGFGALEDWVKSRPGSTVAAVRLINAWYAADGPQPAPALGVADIPRQIFQYWDRAELPKGLAPLVASWETCPGFAYRRFDRPAARKILAAECGVGWVRAFRLARNPAQEADFLRLCLLARFGGVYADADDMLAGDLKQLLGQGRGLIVYREALGGILANNFIAAPPGHPAILYAARMACHALLQRSNETIWSSTGPGLMTRAVGQYLARLTPEVRPILMLYDWSEIASEIFMHNRVAYKSSPKHWNWSKRSPDGVWQVLQEALTEPDRDAGQDLGHS